MTKQHLKMQRAKTNRTMKSPDMFIDGRFQHFNLMTGLPVGYVDAPLSELMDGEQVLTGEIQNPKQISLF